ncbi:MAG TPA: LysM domain-containing protein, partial [Clostridia bacterium]|nr:LysM domain-containing protein [Clostridia bacterium]
FFANGKISNLDKVGNLQFSRTDMGSDFLFSLSENMECLIEQSNTLVGVEKELKRFHKKFPGMDSDEKINGFVNCIKGTYDFIYGVSGENEIEFSKDKLFTGLIITDGRLKAVSTNNNSIYRIRKGKVENLFPGGSIKATESITAREGAYSPAADVVKEYDSDSILPGDMFIFATTNANTKIDNESITNMMQKEFDAEETAWRAVEKIRMHGVSDNFIVMVLRIDATRNTDELVEKSEEKEHLTVALEPETTKIPVDEKEYDEEETPKTIVKPESRGIFSAAASIFRAKKEKEDESEEIDDEPVIDSEDLPDEEEKVDETDKKDDRIYRDEKHTKEIEKDSYKSKLSFPGLSGEFNKVNKKRPLFMKRRMNIYLKRFVSIIVVLALMAGIVWGMMALLKLIFTENKQTVEVTFTPTVTVSPTPEPTPEPTPTPTPEPTPEPTLPPAYIEYTVQAGDTLSKISALFYDGDSNHVAEIVAFNESITDPSLIRVGQVIKIPTLYSDAPGE